MDKTILDLPNEIIVIILKELPLHQFVDCRLISKRFRNIIDTGIRNELIVIIPEEFKRSKIVYEKGSDQLIPPNFENSIFNFDSKLKFFSTITFQNIFKNVRDFYFDGCLFDFALVVLNVFANLEKLFVRDIVSETDQVLNLPNLKDLIILHKKNSSTVSKDSKPCLTIESKIKKFKLQNCSFDSPIVLKYPENLQIFEFGNTCYLSNFLNKFSNLIILKCNNGFFSLNLELFKALKKLEEFYYHDEKYAFNYSLNFCYELRNLKLSKEINLKKIFFNGVELIELVGNLNLESCGFDDSLFLLYFQLDNYQYFSCSEITEKFMWAMLVIAFHEKRDAFKGLEKHPLMPRLPADFFKKFDIRILQLDSVNFDYDGNDFINFLRNCKRLTILEMHAGFFSQLFLDELVSVGVDSLTKIFIDPLEKVEPKKELNFEVFCKLKYISVIEIGFEVSEKVALKLIRSCFRLYKFSYLKLGLGYSIILYKHSSRSDDAYINWALKYLEGNEYPPNKITPKFLKSNSKQDKLKYLFGIKSMVDFRLGMNDKQLEEAIIKNEFFRSISKKNN